MIIYTNNYKPKGLVACDLLMLAPRSTNSTDYCVFTLLGYFFLLSIYDVIVGFINLNGDSNLVAWLLSSGFCNFLITLILLFLYVYGFQGKDTRWNVNDCGEACVFYIIFVIECTLAITGGVLLWDTIISSYYVNVCLWISVVSYIVVCGSVILYVLGIASAICIAGTFKCIK